MTGWRPMEPPRGVLAVHGPIEDESIPLLRLDRKNPPDLDELVLWLATVDQDGEPRQEPGWTLGPIREDGEFGDSPTYVPGWRVGGEVRVRWQRINPCNCDVIDKPHGWHVGQHPGDGEEEPHRPGVFLGVAP